MAAFLFGAISGFGLAIALVCYQEGELFLRLARVTRQQGILATQRLFELSGGGAGRLNAHLARLKRKPLSDQATRLVSPLPANAIVDTPRSSAAAATTRTCANCGFDAVRAAARFCGKCGAPLPAPPNALGGAAGVLSLSEGAPSGLAALREALLVWIGCPDLMMVTLEAVLVTFVWSNLSALLLTPSAAPAIPGAGGIATLAMLSSWLLVLPYTYAGIAGCVIDALGGKARFLDFWKNGIRYLWRCYLAVFEGILIVVKIDAVIGIVALVLWFPALVAGPVALVVLVSAIVVSALVALLIVAPSVAMTTAGAFQDDVDGIGRGLGIARSHRWPLLGVLCLLSLIGSVVAALISVGTLAAFTTDVLAFVKTPSVSAFADAVGAFSAQSMLLSAVWAVLRTVLYGFGLTVFLIYYRRAVRVARIQDPKASDR